MTAPIRQTFDEQLAALQEDVVLMGSLTAQAVHTAVRALAEGNAALSDQVMQIENEIDALNLDIELRASQLLALQQPMARDLNLAMQAVQMDDEVDHAFPSLYDELREFIRRDPGLTSQAISLLLIGVYLERMADNVTNIGERIWYMETGELKELHE